jgi:hypothetical protein
MNSKPISQDCIARLRTRLTRRHREKQMLSNTDMSALADSLVVSEDVVRYHWLMISSKVLRTVDIKVPLVLPSGLGDLSVVRLSLLKNPEGSPYGGQWVSPPGFQVQPSFADSLENARAAVNALDTDHAVWRADSSWVVHWEFPQPPSEGIKDGSAGCIFALGLIELFRGAKLIDPQHRTIRIHQPIPFSLLTASAQISSSGDLQAVGIEGLADKESAAGMKTISHLILSRDQTKKAGLSAASSRQEHLCSNLDQALLKIAALLGEEQGLKVSVRRPWGRWGIAAACAIIGMFLLHRWLVSYPPFEWVLRPPFEWVLRRQGVPESVHIDFVTKPANCQFGVQIDSTTDYMWVTRIWPALANVRSNFALSMGRAYRYPDMRDRVSLAAFGELLGLRALSLDHSEVAMLQGAENLKNLETFVDLGARVSDLRWIGEMTHLRTAVLESGFVEYYPKSFPGNLETLILHLPPSETHWSLSFKEGGDQLKRLALRGDGLKTIGWSAVVNSGGLFSLTGLKEVILHLEEITDKEFKFQRKNLIESIELARCKNLRYFPMGAFPKLKKLRLLGTRFDRIDTAPVHDHLEELEINEDAHLTYIDVFNLPKIKKLMIARTAIKQIKGLKEARELAELELSGMDGDLHEILSEAASFKHLRLSDIPGLSSFDLNEFSALEYLEISDSGITSLVGLQGAKNLRSLIVSKAPLTEIHGLEHLGKLESLDLSETKVRSLERLTSLARLANINLDKTEFEKFPTLGNHRVVSVRMDETPFHRGKSGSPFYRWQPQSDRSDKKTGDFREGYDYRGFGSWESYEYVQTGYWTATPVHAYYSFTPVSTYTLASSPVYSYTLSSTYRPVLQRVGDSKNLIGLDGWEIEPETIPAPPKFDVRAIIEKWGINAKLSIGSSGYGGVYSYDEDVVAPFVDPQKVKNAETKTAQ